MTLNEVLDNIDYFTDYDQCPKKSEFAIFICPPSEEKGELTVEDCEYEGTLDFVTLI